MAIRVGKCTNFGNCSVADSSQIVQVPDGSDTICPECKRALTLTALKQRSSTPYLLFAVFVGLLLGGIAYFAYKTLGPHAPLAAHTEVAEQTALRLCGSNTIGAQLAPALVTAFFKQKGFSDVKVNKTGEDEVKVNAIEAGSAAPETFTVQAHGSATAFTGLAKSSCDIGMASRKIKDAEVRTLAALGDMTSPANEHVLGSMELRSL